MSRRQRVARADRTGLEAASGLVCAILSLVPDLLTFSLFVDLYTTWRREDAS